MLVKFNIEKLNDLLLDFYRITGLTVSVWDTNLEQIGFQPKEMSDFCRTVREYPEGCRRCFMSDKSVIMACARSGKPETLYCHAGLVDTAVPIKFRDKVCGYIMFGQVVHEPREGALSSIKKLCRDLGIDEEIMMEHYNKLDRYDEEKIAAAANILKMSTRYLWLSEYIEVDYGAEATRIDEYITANVSDDLSLNAICKGVAISKNRLYEICRESFGMTVGEYVSMVRIKEAERLLNTTDLPVSRVGEMVGIADYNYFIKFFKSRVGMSPLKYRKSYLLESRGAYIK